MQGLTFQEQADIQRAMYASLHVGRLQPVSSTDSRPIVHSQAAATVLTTTACPSTSAAVDNSDQPPPAKKKRGRPRKYPKAETTVPNAGRFCLCCSIKIMYIQYASDKLLMSLTNDLYVYPS